MAVWPTLFLLPLLFLVGRSGAEEEAPPWGCWSGMERPYHPLCDLEAVWGVALEAVAGFGALVVLLLALVLLGRWRRVEGAEKRGGVMLLLLLLAAVLGLFGLIPAFLIGSSEWVCFIRRAFWAPLFALGFSCLLAQGWRLWRLMRGGCSPSGVALVGVALGFTLVQVMLTSQWLLLTVARQGQPACKYQPLDFSLACCYTLALLLAALVLSAATLFGRERIWRCSAAWLFTSCLASALIWATWLGFYLYGNEALGLGPEWDEPVLAVALVSQGWLLLVLHAIPEAFTTLRLQTQPSAPDYFDTSQSPPRLRESSFDEELPLSHQQYMENQAFSFDEHNAALRSGGYRNGNMGIRSSIPFRSNVYQPTEMTVVMNGGTIPTAPPNYTGRHLW